MSFKRLNDIPAFAVVTCCYLCTPDDVERNFPIMLIIMEDHFGLFLDNLRLVVIDFLLLFDAIVGHGTLIDFRSLI